MASPADVRGAGPPPGTLGAEAFAKEVNDGLKGVFEQPAVAVVERLESNVTKGAGRDS